MPANNKQLEHFLKLFDGDARAAIEALEQYKEASQNLAPRSLKPDLNRRVLISINEISKHYKRGKQPVKALNGVSLDVHEGEFVALTGASGSGKSTLLQLMGGLDKPTSGEIVINDTNINGLKDEDLAEFRNRTIGFVFQFFYLQPFLPLNKNIEVPGMFAGVKPQDRDARVNELLETVGLSEQREQVPKQLSGGQIQRAAVARALLNEPKILLADEPTGNLDSANSVGIIDLFKRIRDTLGTTVVIVTHNPEIAAQADREVRLSDGVLV
jgi:ABC-type lipoprotein export system ATPase subunit